MTATQQPPAAQPRHLGHGRCASCRRAASRSLVDLYQTAVGKKWVMALTGIGLMGFVFAHMVGNLKMYLGPADFNHYGEFLRELLVPILPRTVALWLLRIGLIVAFVLPHPLRPTSLTVMNRKARPAKYQSPRDYIAANFAARTMRWTGIIVLLFLLFHLADLTWGLNAVNPELRPGRGVPEPGRQPRALAGRHHLHRRQPGPRLPPVPRRAGASSRPSGSNSPRFNPAQPAARGFAAGFAIAGGRHQHQLPDHGPRRRRSAAELTRPTIAHDPLLDSKVPTGPIEDRWDNHKFDMKLVNPDNKRKFDVIVVGTGLAGAVGRGHRWPSSATR